MRGTRRTRGTRENFLPLLPLLLFWAYTPGECVTLVLWFRVELATKLNKIANGV
jgi:hypothetical protein